MRDDLIKRSDAIKVASISCVTCLAKCAEDCEKCSVPKLREMINTIPSTDRLQGEWIVYEGEWKNFDYYPPKCKCNQCGYEEDLYILHAKPTNFCPNCGADMREREDE